jgi:hypothetical protein
MAGRRPAASLGLPGKKKGKIAAPFLFGIFGPPQQNQPLHYTVMDDVEMYLL